MFGFNMSSFFGGTSGSSGLFGSFNLGDYYMIKNGSYKRLMKAYYADQKSSSSKTSKDTKSVAEQIIEANHAKSNNTKDTTGVVKMKSQADSLKKSAEAFDKSDVFKQENGEYDTDKIVKSVNDFVSKYNSTIDQAGKTISGEVATQVGYMKSMTTTMAKDLEKIGITVGTDGKLSVKEDTLKNADMKSVEELFSGKNSYAGEIANKAAAIGSAALRDSSFYTSSGTWSSSSSNIFSSQV